MHDNAAMYRKKESHTTSAAAAAARSGHCFPINALPSTASLCTLDFTLILIENGYSKKLWMEARI